MKLVNTSDFEKLVKYYTNNPLVISASYIGASDPLTIHTEDQQIDPLYVANSVSNGAVNKSPSEIREYYNKMIASNDFIRIDDYGAGQLKAWVNDRYLSWLKPANFGVNVVTVFKMLRDQWFIDKYMKSEQRKKDIKRLKMTSNLFKVVEAISAFTFSVCTVSTFLSGISFVPTMLGLMSILVLVRSFFSEVDASSKLMALKGLNKGTWYNIDYRHPTKDRTTCKILSKIEADGVKDLSENIKSYDVVTKINKLAMQAINICVVYDLITLYNITSGHSDLCGSLIGTAYDFSKCCKNPAELSIWISKQMDKTFVPVKYSADNGYEPRVLKSNKFEEDEKTVNIDFDDITRFKRSIVEFKTNVEILGHGIVYDADILDKLNKLEVIRCDDSVSDVDKRKIDSFVRRYGRLTAEFVSSLKTLEPYDKYSMAKEFLMPLSCGLDSLINQCNSNSQLDCDIQIDVLKNALKLDGLVKDSDEIMEKIK